MSPIKTVEATAQWNKSIAGFGATSGHVRIGFPNQFQQIMGWRGREESSTSMLPPRLAVTPMVMSIRSLDDTSSVMWGWFSHHVSAFFSRMTIRALERHHWHLLAIYDDFLGKVTTTLWFRRQRACADQATPTTRCWIVQVKDGDELPLGMFINSFVKCVLVKLELV